MVTQKPGRKLFFFNEIPEALKLLLSVILRRELKAWSWDTYDSENVGIH